MINFYKFIALQEEAPLLEQPVLLRRLVRQGDLVLEHLHRLEEGFHFLAAPQRRVAHCLGLAVVLVKLLSPSARLSLHRQKAVQQQLALPLGLGLRLLVAQRRRPQ